MSATRFIGAIGLDDLVNSFLQDVTVSPSRHITTEHQANRYRETKVKEDSNPVTISLKGTYKDGGGSYFRDFKAALEVQAGTTFNFGDGTRFEMVDVEAVVGQLLGSAQVGATPDQLWAWTAKVISYEPYTRETAPTLQTVGSLNNGNGTFTTNLSLNCVGTKFSEPTWQFTLVIPAAVTVTQVKLQNTTSSQTCTINFGTALTTGTWYVLMDASGGYVPTGLPVPTPNNNGYGLLAASSLGWGCTTVLSGGATTDQDFTGQIPTLQPSTSPTIPPSVNSNGLVATIVATGALTSATLYALAPARYAR